MTGDSSPQFLPSRIQENPKVPQIQDKKRNKSKTSLSISNGHNIYPIDLDENSSSGEKSASSSDNNNNNNNGNNNGPETKTIIQ